MKLFPYGHATHPDWRFAAGMVLAQLQAHMALPTHALAPTLGLLYITDHYAAHAQDILSHLTRQLPGVTDWAGTVGVGIAVNNAEYFDEPALAVMLCDFDRSSYRVFSGAAPMGGFGANTALVHADGNAPDLAELIAELCQRTSSQCVFGGLSSSRGDSVQFALARAPLSSEEATPMASGVLRGGLSGVAFGADVALMSRVTQGCQPLALRQAVASLHAITSADSNVVLTLDGQPALDVVERELNITLARPEEALATLRKTLVGISEAHSDAVTLRGQFGRDTRVRHIVGIDVARRGIAVSDRVHSGQQLAFCHRNVHAARADLTRMCTEIRDALEPQEVCAALALAMNESPETSQPQAARRIAGAVYVSCTGRGGPHFGAPGAELQMVRRALGDVPLVGFFAGGEIAHQHLYGYTGVLTVFTMP